MPSASEMLDQYATGLTTQAATQTPAASMLDNKMAELAQTAQRKKTLLGGAPAPTPQDQMQALVGARTGAGAQTATGTEADLRTMNPFELMDKYGNAAGLDMAFGQGDAATELQRQEAQRRTIGEAAGDAASGIALGAVNSVAGPTAWAAGKFNAPLGVAMAKDVTDLNNWTHGIQSDRLNNRRGITAIENQLDNRDSTAQYEKDKATDGNFVAGLRKIGRDAYNTADNLHWDPTQLADVTSEGLGSMVTAGPMGKVIKAGAGALVPNAVSGAIVAKAGQTGASAAIARAAVAGAEHAPTTAAIAIQEGGGAYQQTAAAVNEMTHEDLMKNSPVYPDLLKQLGGDTPANRAAAKAEVANQAGQRAANIQAPIAALTGAGVAKFEGNLFAKKSFGTALANIGKEVLEESTQGITGQMAQNKATQDIADRTKDLTEGVGENLALSAIGAFGSAGLVQAPTLAKGTAVLAGKGAAAGGGLLIKGLSTVLGGGEAGQRARNEKASPVADATVAAQAEQAVAQAPEVKSAIDAAIAESDKSPEEKSVLSEHADGLMKSAAFDPASLQDEGVPAFVAQAMEGSTTKVDAVQRAAALFERSQGPAKAESALYLHSLLSDLSSTLGQANPLTDALPEGSDARKMVAQYNDLMGKLTQSPAVIKAMGQIEAMFSKMAEERQAKPMTEEQMSTPEGQQQAREAAIIAEVAPEKANLETNQLLLRQAAAGTLKLSPAQVASVKASVALLQATQKLTTTTEGTGTSAQDLVSKNVLAGDASGDSKKSGLQHVKDIVASLRAGNTDLAASQLGVLREFAQHMGNKVGAFNTHLTGGKTNANGRVGYEARNSLTGDWYTAKEGVFVNPRSTNSVRLAQAAGLESKALTELTNALVDAFPELNVGHITTPDLNQALLGGTPDQVVADFKSGKRTSKQAAPVVEKTAADATPTPVQEADQTQGEKQEVVSPKSEEDAKDTSTKQVEEKADKPAAETVVEAEVKEPTKETIVPPVAKEAVTEAEIKEPAAATIVPEVPATPMNKTFPGLVGEGVTKVKNFFKEAFKIPKEERSRLIGQESPLTALRDALSSGQKFGEFISDTSEKRVDPDVAKAYEGVFKLGDRLSKVLDDNLSKFLSTKDVGKRFSDGTDVNRWVEGKLLNLTEEKDGSYTYNRQLKEGAIAAALQFFINGNEQGALLDEMDVSSITGLAPESINRGVVDAMNEGLSLLEVHGQLGTKIEQYWGVTANRNAPIGYTKGLAVSMASEILRGMVDAGMIQPQTFVTTSDGEISTVLPGGEMPAGKVKEHVRYVMAPMEVMSDIAKAIEPKFKKKSEEVVNPIDRFPTAIDKAVLVKPEYATFFGEQRPPVAQTQLRNQIVQNTKQDLQAIEHEQETPYVPNMPMISLYRGLGVEFMRDLFGAGDLNKDSMNKNDFLSKDGKNRTTIAAFQHLMSTMTEMEALAEQAGTDISDFPTRFAMNMTRVNRLQMIGKNTPQSSKIMREALMPNRSTLDLSTEDHSNALFLGLAQALGVKVHTKSMAESKAEVQALMDGPLAEAIGTLRYFYETNSELTDSDKAIVADALRSIGQPTAVALHALTEAARLGLADETDRKNWVTHMYVEADGVTNGPANAMAMLNVGHFTAEGIDAMAKTGQFLGGIKEDGTGKTMNEHRKVDSVDLYQTTAKKLLTNLTNLRTFLNGEAPKVRPQFDHVLNFVSLFNDNVRVMEDGTIELDRGIAKNPLTITIYGSGEDGIAGKVAQETMEKVYEGMSRIAALSGQVSMYDMAQALFPGVDREVAAEKTMKFLQAMDSMTRYETKSFDGKPYLKLADDPMQRRWADAKHFLGNLNAQAFTLTGTEEKNIRSALKFMFVQPMTQAIGDTVGHEVLQSADRLRKATQVQSQYLQFAFEDEIDRALKMKRLDPEWKPGEFLSQAEIDGLYAKLKAISPLVQTLTQTFFIAGSQNAPIGDHTIGANLEGKMRGSAMTYGPKDAGVAGVPFLVIGMGDGQMMQTLATMKGAPKGTLKIFDGMNMRLSSIVGDSVKANEAVHSSWQGNPLQAVYDSYSAFVKDKPVLDLETKPETKDSTKELLAANAKKRERLGMLSRTFFGHRDASINEVNDAIAAMEVQLQRRAQSAEARHRVLQRVNMSVDQMASVGAPFLQTGEVNLQGTSEEMVNTLNAMYVEELKALRKENVTTDELDTTLEKLGRAHSTGVRVMSMTSMQTVYAKKMLEPHKQALLGEILRAGGTKEYKVVFGTAEQIAAYGNATKQVTLSAQETVDSKTQGYTVFGDKTIYMVNPSAETMVHELAHAASFEAVLTHYSGGDLGPNAEVVKNSINNIEKLMAQFLGMRDQLTQVSPEMLEAYDNATQAIKSAAADGNQSAAVRSASALNEFMSWGLTNEFLQRMLKRNEAHPLVQMSQKLFAFIKSLIWGRKTIPTVAGKDMFSNLLFNTAVVIRSQPTIQTVAADTRLFQNAAYGNNDRLSQVQEAFDRQVTAFVSQAADPMIKQDRRIQVSKSFITAAKMIQIVLGRGFALSSQAQTTYRAIVGAMATQAELDGNSMARAQELYAHVVKNLTVDHFTNPKAADQQSDRYYAQQKFDAIVGKINLPMDALGRSTLLSSFLALSIVDDDFRKILESIPLPKSEKSTADSKTDAVLYDVFGNLMEKLGNTLSGQGNKAKTVDEAVVNLAQHLVDVAQDRQSAVERLASPVGKLVDYSNDKISGMLTQASNALVAKGDKLIKSNNKMVRAFGNVARLTGSIASEKNAALVSDSVVSLMNQREMWKPFAEAVADFIGRTASNSLVYDMIKLVRGDAQSDRQQYREVTPQVIREQFGRDLTNEEWSALHTSLGKTDIASLLDAYSHDDVLRMLRDDGKVLAEIAKLEAEVNAFDPVHAKQVLAKSKQLANFMMTGAAGKNLLRNAAAVSNLLGEKKQQQRFKLPTKESMASVDKLITLYALNSLTGDQRALSGILSQQEKGGMSFTMSYLVGQRAEETRKADMSPAAMFNAYKGHIPSLQEDGVHLVIADDAKFADLAAQSYVRVGSYNGSSLESGRGSYGYYYLPVSGRQAFSQGVMQNIRQTAGNVDITNGHTMGMTAGRITDRAQVKILEGKMGTEHGTSEPLMPVYGENGRVVAFERSVDPTQAARVPRNTSLDQMIGVWRGRQVEEAKAQFYNEKLIDSLAQMYKNDTQKSPQRAAEYINVLDTKEWAKDPVLGDAMALMTPQTKAYVKKAFGKEFMVRKDMLNDAFGYRNASVGDMWTGNSRWSDKTQETVKNLAINVFGNKAYQHLVTAEKTLQNFIGDARTLIVVKSVVVPMTNLIGNVYQLISRGVPLAHIVSAMPKKLAEIDSYTKSLDTYNRLEAQLRAASGDVVLERKLKTQMETITDAHKRLSIWPLLEAGEFTAISDAATRDDVQLSQGKLHAYIESKVDQLPSALRTAGRYALITKDTALFQGMQKAVEYGDFLAKAVLFDDITKRQGKTPADALIRVTEEYVNYDRLSGRFRSYLESIGMLWFYNFKIRSTKVALSMIRNNPVHALLAGLAPQPDLFGNVGSVFDDNFFTKLGNGQIFRSLGFGMAFHAPMLNPWVNMVH